MYGCKIRPSQWHCNFGIVCIHAALGHRGSSSVLHVQVYRTAPKYHTSALKLNYIRWQTVCLVKMTLFEYRKWMLGFDLISFPCTFSQVLSELLTSLIHLSRTHRELYGIRFKQHLENILRSHLYRKTVADRGGTKKSIGRFCNLIHSEFDLPSYFVWKGRNGCLKHGSQKTESMEENNLKQV